VTNEKVRELIQEGKLEDVIRERRLQWMGHVKPARIAKVVVNWTPLHGKKRQGRPGTDWLQIVKQDIKLGEFS